MRTLWWLTAAQWCSLAQSKEIEACPKKVDNRFKAWRRGLISKKGTRTSKKQMNKQQIKLYLNYTSWKKLNCCQECLFSYFNIARAPLRKWILGFPVEKSLKVSSHCKTKPAYLQGCIKKETKSNMLIFRLNSYGSSHFFQKDILK